MKNDRKILFVYCIINAIIILVLMFYMIFDKQKVIDKETNTYVQYIERSECKNNNNLPIAGISKELCDIMTDQSLLGDTSYDDVTGTDSCINFEISQKEKYMLAKLNECEAGNQNIKTRELVVLVVLNRVKDSDSFPDTIEEVIKENHNGIYQFSPLVKGGSWYYTEPSADAYLAVDNIMNKLCDDISDGALYFESCKSKDSWQSRNLELLYQSDDMRFYK